MKTTQPNDWSKTPDEHLKASYMGKSEQRMEFRKAMAWLFVLGFAVWLIAVSANELYEIYTKAGQVEAQK